MTTIKLKNGSGAPTAGDLAQGEPALDLTNKRLYTEDSGGTVIEVGTNPTSITTGAITSTGIDVTGTVTADGLTVDGVGRIEETGAAARLTIARTDASNSAASASLDLMENNAANLSFGDIASFGYRLEVDGSTNKFNIISGNQTATKKRFSIDRDGGDISFYEDTGTTAKLFWDASAESLGIGTSSPDTMLHLSDTAGGAVIRLERNDTTIASTDVYGEIQFEGQDASAGSAAGIRGKILGVAEGATGEMALAFQTASGYGSSTERMRIDSSGQVGIGTDSPAQALAVESSSAGVTRVNITNTGNAAAGAGVQLVTKNGATQVSNATLRTDNAGNFSIFSGTTTEAERMRIDSSGNVGIGTTSPQGPLHVYGGEYAYIGPNVAGVTPDSTTGGIAIGWNKSSGQGESIIAFNKGAGATGGLVFADNNGGTYAERMRIDSSGNLLVGGTSYEQAGSIGFKGTGEYSSILSSGAGGEIYAGGAIALVSNGYQISVTTGNAQTYKWHNGTTRSMTLDSSGNLLVGTTTTPTSSAGNIVLANGTAPTASATDGVILYAEDVSSSSELKVRDEAGNITTLSPHNFDLIPQGPSEDMAWSYYSERDGKQINVDMLKAIRVLEKLSGEQLVFEN